MLIPARRDFYLVLWPRKGQDQQVSEFFRRLSVAHSMRWQAHHNTLGGGVSLNDIEAIATPDTMTSSGHSAPILADVTLSVQQWAGGAVNYGWIFDELTADGVLIHSSEAATPTPTDRPLLVIELEPVPEPSAPQGCHRFGLLRGPKEYDLMTKPPAVLRQLLAAEPVTA